MVTNSSPDKLQDANLLVISSSFPQKPETHEGGFVFELVRRLDSTSFKSLVLCPHFYNAPIHEYWPPVRIFRFPYFFPTRYEQLAYGSGMAFNIRKNPFIIFSVPSFFFFEFLFSLYFAKKNPISLINTHWLIPQGFVGGVIHHFLNIPHIATVHGSDLGIIKKHPILHLFCRFIVKNANFVTVNSTYIQRQLIDVVPESVEKVLIIPMGIDIKKFSPVSIVITKKQYKKGKIILCVGRLVNVKGIMYLIDAMPEILHRQPYTILFIIGLGPEYTSLVKQTKDLHLEDKIFFLGKISQDDMPSYYRSADLFILPSIEVDGITEALGVVLLEAMACGCPVIGSNVGGIPDIITDGVNGFLVPEQDSGAIAEKIVILLSDTKLAEQFRQAGYETVRERYSWDEISRQFSAIYSHVISNTLQSKHPE